MLQLYYYHSLHYCNYFYRFLSCCVDDGKLKMEVLETTMAELGEATGRVTCKVIVGKSDVGDGLL